MKRKVIVFAGNEKQFDDHVRDACLSEFDCIYASSPNSIYELHNIPYLLAGEYRRNKAFIWAENTFRLESGRLK